MGAGPRFVALIAECFPPETAPLAPETTFQKLELLKASESGRLAPRASQGQLSHCMGLVGQLVAEAPVDIGSALSMTALRPVVERFANFVRVERPGSKPMLGGEALLELYRQAKAKQDAGTVTLADVKPLSLCKWLRPPAKEEEMKALVAAVRHAATEAGKKLGATPAKAPGKSRPRRDAAVDAALKMFK